MFYVPFAMIDQLQIKPKMVDIAFARFVHNNGYVARRPHHALDGPCDLLDVYLSILHVHQLHEKDYDSGKVFRQFSVMD